MKQLPIHLVMLFSLVLASDWAKTSQRFGDKNGDFDILRQEISIFPADFNGIQDREVE